MSLGGEGGEGKEGRGRGLPTPLSAGLPRRSTTSYCHRRVVTVGKPLVAGLLCRSGRLSCMACGVA